MIKSLLVPIDGSPPARAALSIACSIAGLTKASLTGLFVKDERRFMHMPLPTALAGSIGMTPLVEVPVAPEQLLKAEEEVERESELLQQEFSARCNDARIEGMFVSKLGFPAEVIIDAARSVDFVVIGNSGSHSGVDQVRGGLTTNALLHRTTRPVLVVPEQPAGESRIVIAYDGSPASERVLRAAAEFAEVTELNDVHLLSVSSEDDVFERMQKAALEYLGHYDVELTRAVCQGKPAEVIAAYVEEVDASVLALGAFGNNRLAERIFGSTTSALLDGSDRAVLLMS